MILVSDADFDHALEQALADIPADFQPHLENVFIEVRDRPDAAFMREHDVPADLLGLYVGVPLEEKGPERAPTALPDRIFIFRANLCGMCESREELSDEIRITVLHEIGHHFGLNEERLEDLGYA
ncbi:MAG: metallopeptidase family protein [Phycisphaerae bacterium]|nr:metallopeptidase family protein [Phycisphaerae bacterium]